MLNGVTSQIEPLISSIRCRKDSVALAAVFQARVPSNATASTLIPSYRVFSYPSLAVDCFFLRGCLWCTMFILITCPAYCNIMVLLSMYPSYVNLRFPLRSSYYVPYVYLSLVRFRNSIFLQSEVSLTPNPQPGGPEYPSLCGSSPLTCSAWEVLPITTLSPA